MVIRDCNYTLKLVIDDLKLEIGNFGDSKLQISRTVVIMWCFANAYAKFLSRHHRFLQDFQADFLSINHRNAARQLSFFAAMENVIINTLRYLYAMIITIP